MWFQVTYESGGHTEVTMQCKTCDGQGFKLVETQNGRAAIECECQQEARRRQKLTRTRIPEHYQSASFQSYQTRGNPALFRAFGEARKYAETFQPGTASGLLFTGTIGVGKTHLAVAILRKLVEERGVLGLFTDVRDVFKQLQASYSGQTSQHEDDILRPILSAELLVLDELGAARVTDWTFEVVEHVINQRYNRQRATIITTNFPFLGPASHDTPNTSSYAIARASTREETLGDRIGARMFSRLSEMCCVVEMRGEDYRTKCRAASRSTAVACAS